MISRIFGKVLHRPTIFRIPKFILHLQYGEGAGVLTSSKEVYPKRLLENGFKFKYPTIEKSLKHILKL
ncbi:MULTISPECIES: DUF1731 domain-containing protein [unclassified Lebetimonas]|uniref:DUF1731 domain-containing protein n=1 Tax=unclassified Lebetimonas TaxID=2648158 RepID=UPI0004BB2088|nr:MULTISPECIES: DUF1731 domain-containing protein [unclassified Lebetimonas]